MLTKTDVSRVAWKVTKEKKQDDGTGELTTKDVVFGVFPTMTEGVKKLSRKYWKLLYLPLVDLRKTDEVVSIRGLATRLCWNLAGCSAVAAILDVLAVGLVVRVVVVDVTSRGEGRLGGCVLYANSACPYDVAHAVVGVCGVVLVAPSPVEMV